jgi:hypothetical protein
LTQPDSCRKPKLNDGGSTFVELLPEILSHDPSADTKEIPGAAVLGPGGDEATHCVLDVMYSRSPYRSPARRAFPPHGLRAHSDHSGGVEASGVILAQYGQILKNSANIESLPPGPSRPVSKNRHRASTFVKGSGSLGNFGSSSS